MTMSHRGLVSTFEQGATKGSSSSMFISGDVLYSYGYHFPLLVRMNHWTNGRPFLMNADKYSVTTNMHQSRAGTIAGVLIPFSALVHALGALGYEDILRVRREIELLDKTAERHDETGYYSLFKGYGVRRERLTKAQYLELDSETRKKCWPITERRPEAVLLRFHERYYLSSMDGWNYFISELPEPVETVKQALESLIPFEARGKEYKRQGEWFFIEADRVNEDKNALKGLEIKKWHTLDNSNRRMTGHHKARDYYSSLAFPGPLVRGTIRHTERDHGMLKLGEKWHVAIESRHKGSWGAGGRVD